MRSFGIALLLALPACLAAQTASQPKYSAEGVTNAASYEQGKLAPYAIGTIFGENLSNLEAAVRPEDANSGRLPTQLPGSDVRVYQDGSAVGLFYVSKNQINFLVRATLLPGNTRIRVQRGILSGPEITLTLQQTAPALFQLDANTPVATHLDGSLVTASNPARPGGIVVLWATGLGLPLEPLDDRALARLSTEIQLRSQMDALLDGIVLPQECILWAGAVAGFAGLYQVNLKLPENTARNPEIRLRVAGRMSRPELRLPLEP